MLPCVRTHFFACFFSHERADQFVHFMTNVHKKASEEMKELQESVTAALMGFKSLQTYLAEPLMQVKSWECLMTNWCFSSFCCQPAELLSHMQDFVSSFKETIKINEEARKELQRQTTAKMVCGPIFWYLLLGSSFNKSHSITALRKPPPPPLTKSIYRGAVWLFQGKLAVSRSCARNYRNCGCGRAGLTYAVFCCVIWFYYL